MTGSTVEATTILVKRADGWRVRLEFDDGTVCEQEQPPFATKEEAQRALDLWCEKNGASKTTAQ